MKPRKQDLLDAIEYVGSIVERELVLGDFESETTWLQLNELYDLEDIDPWLEWERGELLRMTPKERAHALEDYRGVRAFELDEPLEEFAEVHSAWVRRALAWRPHTMPPIVVVYLLDGFVAIGDGHGRISYAVGMNWNRVPAVMLYQVQ